MSEEQQKNVSDGEEDAEESQIDQLINNDCDVRKNLFDEFDVPSKQKSSSESSGREYMKVYLRIRPFSKVEIEAKEDQNCVERESDTAVLANAPKESFTFKNGTRAGGEISHRFTFSDVFSEDTTQKAFFDETTLPLVTDFIHGQNCLVFTYGVTNSGKTYTIQGTPKDGGILPRSLDVLFNSIHGKQYDRMNLKPRFYADVTRLQEVTEQRELVFKNALLSSLNKETFDINAFLQLDPDSFGESDVSKMHSCADESSLHNTLKSQATNQEGDTTDAEEDVSRVTDDTTINVDAQGPVKFAVWVSFAEIYNEVIFDLLEPCPMGKGKKRTTLRLGDDSNGNPYIKGLREIYVSNADEAYKILKIGQKNQRIASTKLNQCSSRSHCIFNVKVLRVVDVAEPHVARVSRLSFVDLAGSERYSKTQSKGDRLKEAGNINTSLMTLGKCLEYLRHNQKNPNQPLIIPFRESKLTRLFQGFFCGRGRASMIVNVNMCASLFDETFHVLKFSAIAKKVTTKVSKPVDLPPPPKKTQVSAPTPPSKIARLSVPWANGGFGMPALASDGLLTEQEEEDEEGSGNDQGSCYQQQLVNLVKVLQEKLIEEKRKVQTLEVKIREEVCKEMAEQLVAIETAYSERVKMEVTAVEEKCDRRIELLTQSIKKTRKRARIERVEEDDEEWVPSVFLHAEQIKVQEKEHVVKDLNAKIATLRQEVKQYQDSRKEEVEKSQLVLELQSHLNDANDQVSELKQMLERTGEALLEKDVHIQKLRAALDEEEICTKKQDAALRELTERLETKSAADTADMKQVNVALEGAMSKLAEAERNLEMKESMMTELVRTLEETREELAREKSFVTRASDNEEQMIRLKDELQAVKAQNEALEKDLSSKEESIELLRKLTEQEKAQALERTSQISDAEEKIASKETELERVKNELDTMSCRLNNAEKEIALKVSEMERIKVDANEMETQLRLAKDKTQEKQHELELAERKIAQKATELDNARREVSKKDKELQNAKEEAFKKDSDLKKTEVKLCEMREAVETTKCGGYGKTNFSAQENCIQKSEITDKKEEILQHASKIKELETAIREKSDNLEAAKRESLQRIGQLETELKECRDQIRKLESEETLKELERQLEESTKALDKKNSQVITKNNAIKRLEISLAEKERLLTDMEKLPKEPNLRAKEELKTLRRRVMQADKEVKDVTAAKEEASNQLATAQKETRDAQASLEEAREDIKKKEQAAQWLQEQLDSLSSRNAYLEGELDSTKKASQDKEKAVQEAKEDLLAVKRTSDSELAEMKERLMCSEGKVQDLEDEVFSANEKLSQFQDDVQRYQKETVPELKDRVKTLQQELTRSDDRLKEAEAKLEDAGKESLAQSERRNKDIDQKAKEVTELREALRSSDEEKCQELDKVWQELLAMQQTIEERNKTIYDLETKLLVSGREQNTHKEEIKSLTVQLKTAQEQKLTLEGRLEAVTKNMDFFKSDAGKEKETSVNLKQLLEEQDRIMSEQAQALDERQSEIETLTTEVESWKQKCSLTSKYLDKRQAEIKDLQSQASVVTEEKGRLETQLKELSSQKQATETDASSRIGKVEEEMKTLRRDKCTLEEQLRKKDYEIRKVNESKDDMMKSMREAFEIAKAKKAEYEVKLCTVKEQCQKDTRREMEEELRRARRDFQRQLEEKDRIIEEIKSGKEAVTENETRKNIDVAVTVNDKQDPADVAGNSDSSSSSEASTALPQSNTKKLLKRDSSDMTLAELKTQWSASKTDKADSDEEFTPGSNRKTTRTRSSKKKAGHANSCRTSKLKTSSKVDALPTMEESEFKNDQGTKRRKLFGDIKGKNHNSEDEAVKELAQPNEGRENIPPKAPPSSTKKKRFLSQKSTALANALSPRAKMVCNEEKSEPVSATAIILKQLRTRTIKHK